MDKVKLREQYRPLFKTITLPNGIELDNRIIFSPIITNSSTSEGYATEEELKLMQSDMHGQLYYK